MRTVFKKVIDKEIADELYLFLKYNIEWEDGIKSTRKAKTLNFGDIKEVDDIIVNALIEFGKNYQILGVYLNYYKDGNMYTPSHSHPKTHQLVISLGETRTLNVGKKSYQMASGDAILFGSSSHGVPKEKTEKGRISIATFMLPI